jgi:hypothetical protein
LYCRQHSVHEYGISDLHNHVALRQGKRSDRVTAAQNDCEVLTHGLCRYLQAWDTEDAAKEFLTWGTFQQVDCLASLNAYTAAAVLTRVPDTMRKDLLGMLEPYVAANIVQVGGRCQGIHYHLAGMSHAAQVNSQMRSARACFAAAGIGVEQPTVT